MRNLYKAIGFSGIVEDTGRIERAIGAPGVPPGLVEAVLGVLLDPRRKPRYDEALRGTIGIAKVRQRLGLPADPDFPPAEFDGFDLQTTPDRSRWAVWISVLVILGVLGVLVSTGSILPAPTKAPPVDGSALKSPVPTAVPEDIDPTKPAPGYDPQLPLPHGWTALSSPLEPKVPWTVETDPGQFYFVKLRDAKMKKTVVQAFLHGGQKFTTLSPEGEYEVLYTSGFYWYGAGHQFGPGTRILKLSRIYVLSPSEEGLPHWTLSLERATGGMQPVGRKEFGED